MTRRADLLREISDLEMQLQHENEKVGRLEHENDELQNELDEINNTTDTIHSFLDECVRPTGGYKFTFPDTSRVHDAIRAMADAVGRNI